jgi:hypothetical protein
MLEPTQCACPKCGFEMSFPSHIEGTGQTCPNCASVFTVRFSDTKQCPFCAEEIKAAAIVCRFCESELPPEYGRGVAPTAARVLSQPAPAPGGLGLTQKVTPSTWTVAVIVVFVGFYFMSGLHSGLFPKRTGGNDSPSRNPGPATTTFSTEDTSVSADEPKQMASLKQNSWICYDESALNRLEVYLKSGDPEVWEDLRLEGECMETVDFHLVEIWRSRGGHAWIWGENLPGEFVWTHSSSLLGGG